MDDGKPVRGKSPTQKAGERLLKATRAGDLEGVKAAIDAGADLEVTDNKNLWTPLFWSTTGSPEGHTAVALHLIAAGANVNVKCSSSTPLDSEVGQIVLGRKTSMEVVRTLLAAGADPNKTYKHDRVLTTAKNHPEL